MSLGRVPESPRECSNMVSKAIEYIYVETGNTACISLKVFENLEVPRVHGGAQEKSYLALDQVSWFSNVF